MEDCSRVERLGCVPAARVYIRCSNRGQAATSCRNASRTASRSSSALRSTPASSLGATAGTMTRHLGDRGEGESNRRRLRSDRVCRWRPRALQFPLAHSTVAAVNPGPREIAEAEANLKLSRQLIPRASWAETAGENLLHLDAPIPADQGSAPIRHLDALSVCPAVSRR
jgi:hypothetical protein